MIQTINRTITLLTLIACIALTAMLLTQRAGASAPSGLQASNATTTIGYPVSATTASILFATSTCAARTITTGSQGINLTFSDVPGKVPTSASSGGHFQAASTTVVYDSGQVGCGTFRVITTTSVAGSVSVTEVN